MNLFSPAVLRDLITDVFLNMFRKKLRALLTMTGVIIGAFLVVLIFSLSNGLSEFLDQQVRAVWDARMIKVRLEKGGAPEKAAKGMFGGLGEPPAEIKKENEEEFLGSFKFKVIPEETVTALREIEGVEKVQPEVWVLPRSMEVKGDGREFDALAGELATKAAGDGWVARAVARLSSLVRVRRIDGRGDPNAPDTIVAGAEASLAAGDLVAAVAAVERLAAAQPHAVDAAWLARAKARLAVETALNAMHAYAVSALTQPTPASPAKE